MKQFSNMFTFYIVKYCTNGLLRDRCLFGYARWAHTRVTKQECCKYYYILAKERSENENTKKKIFVFLI